eukprot:13393590-Alexandrium_andersonii.AAC.1
MPPRGPQQLSAIRHGPQKTHLRGRGRSRAGPATPQPQTTRKRRPSGDRRPPHHATQEPCAM